jgi:hypothetical protein
VRRARRFLRAIQRPDGSWCGIGLGRAVALYHRSPALSQICKRIRCLLFLRRPRDRTLGTARGVAASPTAPGSASRASWCAYYNWRHYVCRIRYIYIRPCYYSSSPYLVRQRGPRVAPPPRRLVAPDCHPSAWVSKIGPRYPSAVGSILFRRPFTGATTGYSLPYRAAPRRRPGSRRGARRSGGPCGSCWRGRASRGRCRHLLYFIKRPLFYFIRLPVLDSITCIRIVTIRTESHKGRLNGKRRPWPGRTRGAAGARTSRPASTRCAALVDCMEAVWWC